MLTRVSFGWGGGARQSIASTYDSKFPSVIVDAERRQNPAASEDNQVEYNDQGEEVIVLDE
jgi:hypothetical protein